MKNTANTLRVQGVPVQYDPRKVAQSAIRRAIRQFRHKSAIGTDEAAMREAIMKTMPPHLRSAFTEPTFHFFFTEQRLVKGVMVDGLACGSVAVMGI